MTSFSDTATTNSRVAAGSAASAYDAVPMANLYAGSDKLASRCRGGRRTHFYISEAKDGLADFNGIDDRATTAPREFVVQLARAIGNPVFRSLAFNSKLYSRV